MGRVHVAHFEAGTLASQTARAERGKAALVGDLGERVRLIHELRELRRAEELAHGRGRGLRIDEVLRHDRVDVDRGHALLDGALHPQEAQAILVLHEFADRADATITEMIDVVDLAATIAQIHQRLGDRQDVGLAQDPHRILGIEIEPHVHLDPAHGRQVVAFGIEEQRVEHRLRSIERRRLAGAHHAVDVEEGILARRVLVDRERGADVGTDVDMIDVEDRQDLEPVLQKSGQRLDRDLVAGLGVDLAGLGIEEVLGQILAVEVLVLRLASAP